MTFRTITNATHNVGIELISSFFENPNYGVEDLHLVGHYYHNYARQDAEQYAEWTGAQTIVSINDFGILTPPYYLRLHVNYSKLISDTVTIVNLFNTVAMAMG